jgi:hypothetical protein
MDNFATTLIREKIVFTDITTPGTTPVTARSNRILLHLLGGQRHERVVVRTQSMHLALGMAARVMHSYFRNGLFLNRDTAYDWDAQWLALQSAYERVHNPQAWGAAYINGDPVFKHGDAPMYLNVIEKCAMLQLDNYEACVTFAESAMKSAGKPTHISQETNIAAVFINAEDHMRASIIHRARNKNLTFNFTADGGMGELRIENTIGAAAAFLEALNLKYITDSLKRKSYQGEVPKTSPDAKRLRSALIRMGELNKTIRQFEDAYEVHYRPERPEIFDAD